MDVILDPTGVIPLFRRYQPAVAWFTNQEHDGVTPITWLEVMQGASSRANQAQCKAILSQLELAYLTSLDQQWAMEQQERYQFSHHIGKDDGPIAAAAQRQRLPVYTHNLRAMTPLIGGLAVQPYA